jgi:hypothetical protein
VECIDKWLLRNNRSCPVCKRRVIPGGSDSDSDDTENTSSSTLANRLSSLDNEANEEEDATETSRLLLNNNNTRSNSTNEDDASLITRHHLTNVASGSNLSQVPSNTSAQDPNDLGSLNNQMMTSLSNNSMRQGSKDTPPGGSGAEGGAGAVGTSLSKYGSISSINQIVNSETDAAGGTSAMARSSKNEYEYSNLNYNDDDEEDVSVMSSRPTCSTKAKTIGKSSPPPPKFNSTVNNNNNNNLNNIDSKQTPEFHTPYDYEQSSGMTHDLNTSGSSPQMASSGSTTSSASAKTTTTTVDKEVQLKTLKKSKRKRTQQQKSDGLASTTKATVGATTAAAATQLMDSEKFTQITAQLELDKRLDEERKLKSAISKDDKEATNAAATVDEEFTEFQSAESSYDASLVTNNKKEVPSTVAENNSGTASLAPASEIV